MAENSILRGMCPHCGGIVRIAKTTHLTYTHNWPKFTRQVCPGSHQNPRNAESDGRPLWNGKPNRHYYRNVCQHPEDRRRQGILADPDGYTYCLDCDSVIETDGSVTPVRPKVRMS